MLELNGIYSEYGMFSWDSITVEHIDALEALGFVLRWDYENRLIEVVYDTAVMDHKRCEELDTPLGLEMVEIGEGAKIAPFVVVMSVQK